MTNKNTLKKKNTNTLKPQNMNTQNTQQTQTWYTLIFDNGYQIWTIDNSQKNIERNERIFKGKIIEVIAF